MAATTTVLVVLSVAALFVWAVRKNRRDLEQARIAKRADQQMRWTAIGDPRGTYGGSAGPTAPRPIYGVEDVVKRLNEIGMIGADVPSVNRWYREGLGPMAAFVTPSGQPFWWETDSWCAWARQTRDDAS
jgi:hypothetical protein